MQNKKSISILQVILTVLFVTCFLISNVMNVKQIQLPFGIVMPSAMYIFPLVYVLSDLFSEVYGYKWSRITCYMSFAANIIMVVFFQLAIITKAPDYYTLSDDVANVLGSSLRTLVASLAAYLAGDLCNDLVFKKMKEKHIDSMKGFEIRSIFSSFVGEVVDSMIFIPVAFIGLMPAVDLVIMAVTQVGLKVLYEIIILPLTRYVVKKVREYEGE